MVNPFVETEAYECMRTGNRAEWLMYRNINPYHGDRITLGGSDAGAVLGVSTFTSRRELYDRKRSVLLGEKQAERDAGADAKRGTESEAHIRALFAIEHPEYEVLDGTGCILYSKRYPWMSASLDGVLAGPAGLDKAFGTAGDFGVLEIKSCRWNAKWEERGVLPDAYFVQVLHYLAVTGFRFAVVRARLLSAGGNASEYTYRYDVTDSAVAGQIDALIDAERAFIEDLEAGRRPNFGVPM